MKIDHQNVSLYIPKRIRNFIKVCMLYSEKELSISKFSSFVIMCIRYFINSLDHEEKAKFESYARQLEGESRSKASKFVDDFIEQSKETDDGN